MDSGIIISLTKHAKIKIHQRNISLNDIKKVVITPMYVELDKLDKSLTHFIGFAEGKFLRIIGRWKSKEELLVISAFFDRRLMKKEKA